MTFQADALSLSYDYPAGEMITRAIGRPGDSVLGVIASAPGERREQREPHLSRSERAFTRALYRDRRIHIPRKSGRGEWSLPMPEWGPVVSLAGVSLPRTVRIRVHSDTSGARRVRLNYTKEDSYIKNPELRASALQVDSA
jgi:hypothetical protein